ncbi:MAG TPA: ATP-binding protein, partial [Chitinophagaceae bacterium]|nr:ATP-binding protein [Chitinophagaceae bacterium]
TYKPDGTPEYFNSRWYEYIGKGAKNSTDKMKFLHPADLPGAKEKWETSLLDKIPFEGEYRLRRHDGEYRWQLAQINPVRNEEGKITSWTGTLTDIHEQKNFAENLENKVRERTLELRQTIAQLDQFAHVASHDLQEPLRKIQIFSSRLQQRFLEDLPKEAVSYLNKISGASTRMTKLIKDLLEYSRLMSHEKLFQFIDLNDILKDVLRDFDLLLEQKSGHLKIGNLPEIEAIPLQMNQLFYNLIGNALKFSKDDVPPEIMITSREPLREEIREIAELDSGLQYAEIIVRDNGIGFDKKYARQIFIIFQRLNDRNEYEGTGIGLAVCKKIAENHFGTIYAESSENQGATFRVFLPIKHPRK